MPFVAFSSQSKQIRRRLFRVCKRGKNKDSFGKKQYFFLIFVHPVQAGRLPAAGRRRKPLLNKGFNQTGRRPVQDFSFVEAKN
jgi:hypothetical protein